MPETPKNEFWRDIKPIDKVFQADALPEVYIHNVTATAGDFVYETPGEAHTLVAYEHPDPMKAFFVVKGPVVWLDEEGKATGTFDVHDYIAMCRDYYEKIGLGRDYVKKLFR